jgi:hypothetical protein
MPRSSGLHEEMTRFLKDSGYGDPNEVCVLTDGALDLLGVANDLPFDSVWVLDWAHIGRLLRNVDQAITPLAYGQLTANGSAFELWDTFVRVRNLVWTGETVGWQQFAEELDQLLELRAKRDLTASLQARQARIKLTNVVTYLQNNIESLIDYRTWQRVGR